MRFPVPVSGVSIQTIALTVTSVPKEIMHVLSSTVTFHHLLQLYPITRLTYL